MNTSAAPLRQDHPHDERLASSFEVAMERTDARRRRNHSDRVDSNESLQMYIGAVCVVAMVHGLSLMGLNLSVLLNGAFGWLLVGIMAIGVLFKVIFDLRLGHSFTRSIVETILFGALTYGLVFGVFWYLDANLLHSGKPWFSLPALPTPHVPTPTPGK